MALFTLQTSSIKRGKGRSAIAAAAYRAGAEIVHERRDLVHDYTRKRGVEHVEVFTRQGIPAPDISELWNAAEAAEKRKDARTAREVLVALPAELDGSQRLALAREVSADLAERYGVAAQLAVHAPDAGGDQRNYHAHILLTTRAYGHDGLGKKAQLEWSGTQCRKYGVAKPADELYGMRERWSAMQNEALERANIAARVDHRSLVEQGIDRAPQIHVGNYGTQMIRAGTPEESERASLNLEIIDTNREVQHLRDRLDAERAIAEWSEVAPAPATGASIPDDPAPAPGVDDQLTLARQSLWQDAEDHIGQRHWLQIRADRRSLARTQQRLDEEREEREWAEWISQPGVCSATGRLYTENAVDVCIQRERALPQNQPPPGGMTFEEIAEKLEKKAQPKPQAPEPAPAKSKAPEPAPAKPEPKPTPAPPAFDAEARAREVIQMDSPDERAGALREVMSDLDMFEALQQALEPFMIGLTGELLPEGERLRAELLPPDEDFAQSAPERDQEEPVPAPRSGPDGPGL